MYGETLKRGLIKKATKIKKTSEERTPLATPIITLEAVGLIKADLKADQRSQSFLFIIFYLSSVGVMNSEFAPDGATS
jgi:hypothetical protein